MSKIRVLSDQLINQIAAGEVVERPASVAKELVENAIDAGGRRISVDVEGGGRRLLRVVDDGEGMTRDDAVLAFERHATSKIASADDLNAISTLGFRGEALASIASVARVELVTKTDAESAGTRVVIEGGRMRDVKDAAHPRGTSITVRDLFFNVPARRKFLRSEATESFHLTNLVMHYALAHPEIAFTLTNNGRETLRAAPARDLRERAYQIFGAEFLENLLEVGKGHERVARVGGYVSAPSQRRTSRDAQFLFINGRYVRDRLVSRALTEGYRAVLPQGTYPAALLFLEVPLEEVDVNVHPAKTEVRFRRAAAVADAVRESVRGALRAAGYVRASVDEEKTVEDEERGAETASASFDGDDSVGVKNQASAEEEEKNDSTASRNLRLIKQGVTAELVPPQRQSAMEFQDAARAEDAALHEEFSSESAPKRDTMRALHEVERHLHVVSQEEARALEESSAEQIAGWRASSLQDEITEEWDAQTKAAMPPLASVAGLVREVPVEALSTNIKPLGQLEDSYIIATDNDGLLLIEQHVAHERILFDKYRAQDATRAPESQNLLLPETFDLTPAQAAAFETVAAELESYGFALMRLSGRTVAIRAVPADLPAGEARSLLAEVLDTIDAERRGAARTGLSERIAASLACRAAIKAGTPLTTEKMRWLITRLLTTSSPTTCPHGRSVILRLTTRDIAKGFHRG